MALVRIDGMYDDGGEEFTLYVEADAVDEALALVDPILDEDDGVHSIVVLSEDPVMRPKPQDWFNDVFDFHEKFGCAIGDHPAGPGTSVRELRLKLINEERDELAEAMEKNDIVGVADALADLIYVTIGTAIAYGIDLRPVWDEVQRSNMAKEGGGTRADGKVMKPAGWIPPDVAGALNRQGYVE